MSEEKYEYTDENGKIIAVALESNADHCPACKSTNIKCKGSFHKCLECGERFSTAIWVLPAKEKICLKK